MVKTSIGIVSALTNCTGFIVFNCHLFEIDSIPNIAKFVCETCEYIFLISHFYNKTSIKIFFHLNLSYNVCIYISKLMQMSLIFCNERNVKIIPH